MKEKVLKTVTEYDMLVPGDRVAVAVSGGKDSVALLHILADLREALSLHLTVVHIHHHLRGQEADRDAAFVQALAASLALPYKGFEYDVSQEVQKRSMSIEECGRVLRYEALRSLGTDKIATAHTLSDSVETMLFHLARGSGIKGLCGIPAVNGNIVRPLIECTSQEVLAYLEQQGIDYVSDSTNADTAFTRNRIRANIVPQLQQVNPAFEQHAAHTMKLFSQMQSFVRQLALQVIDSFPTDARLIASLPKPALDEALRMLCEKELGVVPEYEHLQNMERILKTGGRVQINSGAFVCVRNGLLFFPKEEECGEYFFTVVPGSYSIPLGTLHAQVYNCEQFENLTKHPFSFAVDYDTMKNGLICRNKHAGDRFYDGRRKLTKSMKKYLNEIAFVPEKRGAFPVFVYEDTVIGTLGSYADTVFAPSATSQNILYIYWED